MENKKKLYASYISDSVNEVAEFLIEREDLTKVSFVRRAIEYFLAGSRHVDPRILNKKKSSPDYISRGALFSVYLDDKHRAELESIAKENGCNVSDVFFQVLIDFCAALICVDSTGITIDNK